MLTATAILSATGHLQLRLYSAEPATDVNADAGTGATSIGPTCGAGPLSAGVYVNPAAQYVRASGTRTNVGRNASGLEHVVLQENQNDGTRLDQFRADL
jgi:hypothetical protein